MNSKTIAIIAVFGALTIVLNLSPVKFPAPYATFLIYQLWEIPIVTAFILYGLKVGVAISIINTLVLLGVFPGELPTGPFYNLIAVLSMLLGIYAIHLFARKSSNMRNEAILVTSSTAFGAISRVVVMTIVNWSLLRFPPPIGFNIPEGALVPMLPLIGFFNATLALYTIPIGYFLARAVSFGTNTPIWSQKHLKLESIPKREKPQ